MATVLDDLLVRLGFKIDQDGLAKFKLAVGGVTKIAALAASQVAAIGASAIAASYDTRKFINVATHTNTSITGLKTLERTFERITGNAQSARGAVSALAESFKKYDPVKYGEAIQRAFPNVKAFDKNGNLRDMTMLVREIAEAAQKLPTNEAKARFRWLGFGDDVQNALLDKRFIKSFDEIYKEEIKLNAQTEKYAEKMERVANAWDRVLNTLEKASKNSLAEFIGITDLDEYLDRFSLWLTEEYPRMLKSINSFVASWMPGGRYWESLKKFMGITAEASKQAVTKTLNHTRANVYDMATWDEPKIQKYAEENNLPLDEVRNAVLESQALVAQWKKDSQQDAKKQSESAKKTNSLLQKINEKFDFSNALSFTINPFGGLMTAMAQGAEKLPAQGAKGAPPVSPGRVPAGASGPATPYKGTREERIRKAHSLLTAEGYTDEQSAGMIGVLLAESGLDPTVRRKGGTDSGIAQWKATRQPGFWRTYEQVYGKGSAAKYGGNLLAVPLEEQLRVYISERPEIMKQMRAAQTSEEAMRIAFEGLENGSGTKRATREQIDAAYAQFGYGYDTMYTNRLRYTERALRTIKAPPSKPASKPATPDAKKAASGPAGASKAQTPAPVALSPVKDTTPPTRADMHGIFAYMAAHLNDPPKGAAPAGKTVSGNTVNISNIFNGPADPERVRDAVETAIADGFKKTGQRYSINANFA